MSAAPGLRPECGLDAPVFVIGGPRSGTTLVRLMLTCHPALVVPPECGFIAWLHPRFGEWDGAAFSDSSRIASFAQAVSQCRKFETWGIRAEAIESSLRDEPVGGYAEACARVYRLYGAGRGKPSARWGDKNNTYVGAVPLLRALYPAARFLHVVRDGRDVACSYREVMAAPSDSPYRPRLPTGITDIAQAWLEATRQVSIALSDASDGATCTIRYEDLAADPQLQAARVCAWLGLAFDPAMLAFHAVNTAQQLEPRETMDWKSRTMAPVSAATVGRFAALLDRREILEFQRVAGPQLEALGYPLVAPSSAP